MKILQKVFYMLIAVLALASCDRDYDAPPLNEPKYDGPKANITIASLKQQFAAATQDLPSIITTDLILKAYVSANDESGNIYKQIYLQDATGAIPILADFNGVFGLYRVGQEVYVNLKGLCISVYGDEQQIGIPTGYLYRLLKTDFQEHVLSNGWPDKSKVEPKVITNISLANENVAEMTFRLVRLEGVYFVNGGKDIFAPSTGYGTQTLKDSYGNSVDVRTSNYADFASETLPIGKGTVIAILGRFRGAWQVTIPTGNDYFDFDGIVPGEGTDPDPEPGGETVLFKETFGTPAKVSGNWPFLKDYTGFDNAASMFEDASGKVSVRNVNNLGNLWYPTGSDINVTVKGINAKGAQTATLTYKVGSNVVLFEGETGPKVMNLNALKVRCNGVDLAVPSKEVSSANNEGNLPFEMTIENVAVSDNTVLEFYTTSAVNTYGLRLFEIKLATTSGGSGSGEIVPD